jgi:hypothetical protein
MSGSSQVGHDKVREMQGLLPGTVRNLPGAGSFRARSGRSWAQFRICQARPGLSRTQFKSWCWSSRTRSESFGPWRRVGSRRDFWDLVRGRPVQELPGQVRELLNTVRTRLRNS